MTRVGTGPSLVPVVEHIGRAAARLEPPTRPRGALAAAYRDLTDGTDAADVPF